MFLELLLIYVTRTIANKMNASNIIQLSVINNRQLATVVGLSFMIIGIVIIHVFSKSTHL